MADGSLCNCPICRNQRNELTDRELAWYLKGKIEARSADYKVKTEGKFGHESELFKTFESYLRCMILEDESYLKSLLSKVENQEISSDMAFLDPRKYVPNGV